MNMVEETCVIRLKRRTRERLRGFGKKGDTYDDIITKLMDETEKRRGQ